jgi:alcohol dehydrogenase class IV
MALASLFSGMALANAKLGAVHGFAAPLGAMLGAAHGEICAALLPHVMEANIAALRAIDAAHPSLDRYAETGGLLTGERDAAAGVRFIRSLCADLGVRGLGELGFNEPMMDEAARKAADASSMKGNPVRLGHEELTHILRSAL